MIDRRVDAPLPASLSDAVPSEGYALTPLVGLYASFETLASLASLEALVAGLPERSGLAFAILMQSTQDGLVSALEAALARVTSMPVLHFIEGARLVSDTVHLLPFDAPLPAPPPNGQPRPTPLHSRPPHAAFDLFLRAFAETHGAHFATVRFADAGAEGVVGLTRLRERGGLVVAQDRGEPGSGGEHADRRRAPFEGLVDVTLPLAQTGVFWRAISCSSAACGSIPPIERTRPNTLTLPRTVPTSIGWPTTWCSGRYWDCCDHAPAAISSPTGT
jgi:hypothetical protein